MRADQTIVNSAQREQRELADVSPRTGAAAVRARAGSRRARGAAQGRLPLAVRGPRASAHRPHPPARRAVPPMPSTRSRSRSGARITRRRTSYSGRGVPEDRRHGQRPRGSAARAGARPGVGRRQAAARGDQVAARHRVARRTRRSAMPKLRSGSACGSRQEDAMRVARACFGASACWVAACVVLGPRAQRDATPASSRRAARRLAQPIVYTAEVDGIIHPDGHLLHPPRDRRGRRRKGRRSSSSSSARPAGSSTRRATSTPPSSRRRPRWPCSCRRREAARRRPGFSSRSPPMSRRWRPARTSARRIRSRATARRSTTRWPRR